MRHAGRCAVERSLEHYIQELESAQVLNRVLPTHRQLMGELSDLFDESLLAFNDLRC